MRSLKPRRARRALEEWIRQQRCNVLAARSYLDRSLVHRDDVHWLFILAFPNGGSTAIAKLLLTAPHTTSLTPRAEGQWLIPSMSRPVARWSPDHRIWPRRLRAVWLNAVPSADPASPVLVVEKSPPNLCRYRQVLDTFESMATHLVVFPRDPYAVCASWRSKHGRKGLRDWIPRERVRAITSDWDLMNTLGSIWIERARRLAEAKDRAALVIRYEDFADDPALHLGRLGSRIPQLRDVRQDARVKVKDYPAQPFRNMNDRQVAQLDAEDVAAISAALATDADTVHSLGYAIR